MIRNKKYKEEQLFKRTKAAAPFICDKEGPESTIELRNREEMYYEDGTR